MAKYLDRLTEIIYKASDVKLITAQRIARKITEAGYRLPEGKAPLLTDEQIMALVDISPEIYKCGIFQTADDLKGLLKAQNDADNKWHTSKER